MMVWFTGTVVKLGGTANEADRNCWFLELFVYELAVGFFANFNSSQVEQPLEPWKEHLT